MNLSKFLRITNGLGTPLALFALDSSFLSPTSDGGAAAVVCSEEFVRRNRLENKAVEILAMDMATDTQGTFDQSGMSSGAHQALCQTLMVELFCESSQLHLGLNCLQHLPKSSIIIDV